MRGGASGRSFRLDCQETRMERKLPDKSKYAQLLPLLGQSYPRILYSCFRSPVINVCWEIESIIKKAGVMPAVGSSWRRGEKPYHGEIRDFVSCSAPDRPNWRVWHRAKRGKSFMRFSAVKFMTEYWCPLGRISRPQTRLTKIWGYLLVIEAG